MIHLGEEISCPRCGGSDILYYDDNNRIYNSLNEFYKFRVMTKHLRGKEKVLYLLEFAIIKKKEEDKELFPYLPLRLLIQYYNSIVKDDKHGEIS